MIELDDIRKLQMLELEIAKEIKRICEKNDIPYFLVGGTLLGAIRHNGFIPWDDDMDIGMTLENWKKFIECAKQEMDERFSLEVWDEESEFGYPFAKMRLKDTVMKERVAIEVNKDNCGIWVDIFPYIPTSKKKIKNNLLKLQLVAKQYLLKKGYNINAITTKRWKCFLNNLLFIFAFPFSNKTIKKYYQKCINKMIVDKAEVYLESDGRFTGNFIFEKDIFDNFVEKAFENTTFTIPVKYDKYLKKAYGDYMQLPPESERNIGHSLVEIYLKRDYKDYFKLS